MELIYEFTEENFIDVCSKNLARKRTTVFEDIYKSLCHFLNFPSGIINVIKEIKHKYKIESYDSHLSLPDYICNEGLALPYIEFELSSDKKTPLDIKNIHLPKFLELQNIQYGGGIKRNIKVRQHSLKTKNKSTVVLLSLTISNVILKKIYNLVKEHNVDLIPSKLGVWEWQQTFYNKLSGECYFCSCFENAINKEEDFTAHPHVRLALAKQAFKTSICHLCTKTNSDLFYCHPMYASSFKVKYGSYIRKFEIDENLNEKDAENKVRELKGVAKIGERWINETLLFNYINALFPDYLVKREATPNWLGKQRLDLYIPELNLAIEYQGQQHYKPIELFGGEGGFKNTRQMDKEKLNKCKQNGINLVYFTYKDNLSEKLVHSRLKKYLNV